MSSKILINALDSDECRIAKVKDSKLEEFHLEAAAREITQGNIYKGIITRIEPSLQAVFVDYGTERHGFLQRQEIHSDYLLDSEDGDRALAKVLRRGQELIVQVTKDPIMNKGAMLTTYISLPGRHIVLMPGTSNRGVSRKITDEDERTRLKGIIDKLKIPDGFGLIVRTAGKDATKTMMSKDLSYLLRLWKDLNKKVNNEPAPVHLYKERNLAVRSIRDYFTPDVTEILIDDIEVHKEIKSFVQVISPKQAKLVKLHKGAKPIFTKYQLENQVASIFQSRVPLKSGGTIVIDQTEALVAIDVNSGKATQSRNIEQTALQTNIEAAEEISRQLRLRDLGGLIVIDFIDMRDTKNKSQVEAAMKSHLKDDKARTKVGRISRFGLMEMSRQRIRPSIEFGSFIQCNHCKGKGTVLSPDSLGLAFLRKLSLETLKEEIETVRGIVPVEVANYLHNKKRGAILEMELRRELSITIEGDASLMPGESKIICE